MKKLTIEIKEKEYDVLNKRVEEKKEFTSVEEYISDIISQVVDRLRDEEGGDDETYSKEDEEKVKERLKSLGYLD